jgi:hypothetical protein
MIEAGLEKMRLSKREMPNGTVMHFASAQITPVGLVRIRDMLNVERPLRPPSHRARRPNHRSPPQN